MAWETPAATLQSPCLDEQGAVHEYPTPSLSFASDITSPQLVLMPLYLCEPFCDNLLHLYSFNTPLPLSDDNPATSCTLLFDPRVFVQL